MRFAVACESSADVVNVMERMSDEDDSDTATPVVSSQVTEIKSQDIDDRRDDAGLPLRRVAR